MLGTEAVTVLLQHQHHEQFVLPFGTLFYLLYHISFYFYFELFLYRKIDVVMMCLFVIQEAKLKDLDEELKVLGEGLSTIEEVRDWLFTRITAIQEEKLYVKSVDRYSSQDVSTAFCNPDFDIFPFDN